AATNRPDILDPALLRPGRFDRRVVLDRPDRKGREDILKIHVRGKPLAPDVDLGVLAKRTPGFTGADIENLVNEAAILAARRNKRAASMEEFTEAVDRVIAGPERRSRIISDKEKRITAYHEAGHALCFAKLENTDRVDKVSIIARGMYGGYTLAVPDEDRNNMSRSELADELAATLGGRAAEATVFNEITTGASQDLRQATQTARNMVMQWGMSETLGQRTFGKKEELVFLGREIAEQRDYSEEVAAQIDREIKGMIDGAYERALWVVTTYRDRLDAIANRLIEVETLERAEFEAIVNAEAPASA
ncbi:MAG: cell division protein FtsH, partial [Chloroflexi bacterium]|nr:cell division protein FtsH [Chloroflexota bacterium]